MLGYLRRRIRRQTCTNIDIGGIAVAGTRTMVAGGFVRSRQFDKLLRLTGLSLLDGSSSRARDKRKYCNTSNDLNSLGHLIHLISVISAGDHIGRRRPTRFPLPRLKVPLHDSHQHSGNNSIARNTNSTETLSRVARSVRCNQLHSFLPEKFPAPVADEP
jgi:hypothetical protein